MGRRKERRIAALAAGRRVKLDLFAEPSGDLGGSSAQDEVGGDDDTKNRAGLPNSPSSSGKQPENPLVLLGQYSDDELDDGSSGEQNQAPAEDSFGFSDDGQEKVSEGRGSEDIVIEERNGPTVEKAEQLQAENVPALLDSSEKLEEDGGTEIIAAEADVLRDENCLTGKVSAASTSDTQVGDVTSGWKIVWHEESNQYYYWNITTGETSWEVPDVLPQAAGLRSDTANNGEKERAADVSNSTYRNCEITEGSDDKVLTETLAEDYAEDTLDDKRWDPDTDQNHLKSCSLSARVQNFGTSPGTNVSSRKSNDGLVGEDNVKNFDSLKPGYMGSYETGNLSSSLIEQCELLLEKLNNVKGSKNYLHGHVHMQIYILEIEMRLGDIRSLACHGSLLRPFWEHSEHRLQQLEANINDFLQELKAEQVNEVAPTFPENSSNEVNANCAEKRAVSAVADDFCAPEPVAILEVRKHNLEAYDDQAAGDQNAPLERCLTGYSGNASGDTEEDMDVDMEVEDAAPSSNLIISVTSEQLSLPTVTADQETSALGEGVSSVPPPPDEDWIPPPPPDDEPFPPPPPPDDPPESSYPQPSDLVSIPSFPYVEQYNIYPSSHFQYFTQTHTDVASSSFYTQTEVCQPAVSQSSLYFEALPDTYSPGTLAVNPVESGLYYGLQDGMTQPPVQNPISDAIGSLDTRGELGSASLTKGEVDVSAVDGDSKMAFVETSATNLVTESVSVSSIPTTTATVAASATASKAQSKVPRNKKRSVAVVSSLRSNKKVSSLVDKWKAAKEELQEQEKEPENAYEILERKRQRGIEEWHNKQIYSGEAKDNANFQPLGGDWRERVKRKRAQLAKESVRSPSDGVSEVNPELNLDELSKDLPRGWQAYWDDSSKQVYYGHTLTSETSWIRPTG